MSTAVEDAIERALGLAADRLGHARSLGDVRIKLDGSPVTELDTRLEAIVREALSDGAPIPILAEEGSPALRLDPAEPYWVVDPIDGTKNFVLGLPIMAVSIAQVRGRDVAAAGVWASLWGAPLLSWQLRSDPSPSRVSAGTPMIGIDLDHPAGSVRSAAVGAAASIASRIGTVRVLGSTATALSCVALGVLDAYLRIESPIWDYAGGVGLVAASGGQIRSPQLGQPSPYLLAGRRGIDPRLWHELTEVAARAIAKAEEERP